MKLRRLAAAAAASVIALTAAPAASAQDLGTLLGLDQVASAVITNAKCSDVKTALNILDKNTPGQLLTDTTTRNQLAANLRDLAGKQGVAKSGVLALAAVKYSGQTADKALACGIVKKDSIFTGGGSELSSKLNDYGPMLSSMLGLDASTLPIK